MFYKKKATKIKFLTFAISLLFFIIPTTSHALEFTKYNDLIEYTEDFTKNEVHYKYKTNLVPKKKNEIYERRESDKEFFTIPSTNKIGVKIYSGDNYIQQGNEWYQLEYATTTEINFFNTLEELVQPKTLFEKMISILDFNFAIAQSTSTTQYVSYDAYWQEDESNWDTGHDSAQSNLLNTSAVTLVCGTNYFDSQYNIYRCALNFDTSFLDGYTIDSAILNLYASNKQDTDNDSQAYLTVVESQVVSDASFAVEDYDLIGDAIDDPTKLSSDFDISSITLSSYNEFTLNSSGFGVVDKTGVTKLGLREGHDIEDDAIVVGGHSRTWFYSVDQTGTTYDPYLYIIYSEEEASTATCTPIVIVGGIIPAIIALIFSLITITLLTYEPARRFAGLG
jgi:hypothetical protein